MAPAELEAVLLTHPDVVDAAVIGVPSEETGESPKGFVVKKPSSNVTSEELCDYVAGTSRYRTRPIANTQIHLIQCMGVKGVFHNDILKIAPF